MVWHHRAHATDCLIVTASHSTGNYTTFQNIPLFLFFLNTGNSARQPNDFNEIWQAMSQGHSLSLPPLSLRFNGHCPGESGSSGFTGAKDDGSGGDNWSYKTCKAPVKSLPPNFLQAKCPSCRQTDGVKTLKGKCPEETYCEYSPFWPSPLKTVITPCCEILGTALACIQQCYNQELYPYCAQHISNALLLHRLCQQCN